MQTILDNIVGILGFGFLGLSFLFVYLAYTNVKQIVAQDDPNESAVNLSRFFMKTALVFMICAGPLQWVSLTIDHYLKQGEVTLHVTMTHPDWDPTYGNVLLVVKGKPYELINRPYVGTYKQNDEIQLNASRIAQSIRKIRTQLTVLNSNISKSSRVDSTPSENLNATTRAILDGG